MYNLFVIGGLRVSVGEKIVCIIADENLNQYNT